MQNVFEVQRKYCLLPVLLFLCLELQQALPALYLVWFELETRSCRF